MAMENGPVEDVFPIENRDFPASHVSSLEETSSIFPNKKPWGSRRRHLPRSSTGWPDGSMKGGVFRFPQKQDDG